RETKIGRSRVGYNPVGIHIGFLVELTYPDLDRSASTKEGQVSAIKMSWQTETDHLVCRWSEAGRRVQYHPRWLEDAAINLPREQVTPAFLDFTRLNPFGGRRWFAPDRVR